MPLAAADITPTLDQVASNVRTLTRNGGGGEEGTFNDHTRPNAAEAEVFVARAARYVANQLGQPDFDANDGEHDEFLDTAKDAVATYAALQIATSFFDDGSDSISALIDQLGRLAREQIQGVISAARSNTTGGTRINSIPVVSSMLSGVYDVAPLQPAGVAPDNALLAQQVGNLQDPEFAEELRERDEP